MKQHEIYISKFSAWAPGIETKEEWSEWAQGKREMHCDAISPGIKFTDPLFRRRLSQISKMTIQVVHDLLPIQENTKMLFVSFRGELHKQFSVNESQIEEGAISPAAFSFSVFNAPVALTSMALDLKGGYTALYPANDSLKTGLCTAAAMLNTGTQEELIFIYADENIPEQYIDLTNEPFPPFAFALLLSKEKKAGDISYLIEQEISPRDFLRHLF